MKTPLSYDQAKERLDDANRRYDEAEAALARLRKDRSPAADIERAAIRVKKIAAANSRNHYRDMCEEIHPIQHRFSWG